MDLRKEKRKKKSPLLFACLVLRALAVIYIRYFVRCLPWFFRFISHDYVRTATFFCDCSFSCFFDFKTNQAWWSNCDCNRFLPSSLVERSSQYFFPFHFDFLFRCCTQHCVGSLRLLWRWWITQIRDKRVGYVTPLCIVQSDRQEGADKRWGG